MSTSSELVLNKTNSNKLDYLYEASIEPEVVNPVKVIRKTLRKPYKSGRPP